MKPPLHLPILSALALVAACAASSARTAPQRELAPAVPVRTERAEQTLEPVGDEVVGTVRARNVASLSSSVMGTVRTLKVAVGDRVRAGQVLIQLSAGELEAKAAQAEAAFARAKTDLDRAERLKASQAIAETQHEAAASQLRVAEAALREAHAVRDYMVIRAPFAGIVTAKECNAGDLAVPGKPLLVIENPGELRLEAYAPEAAASSLTLGQTLPVRIDALSGSGELTATVSEVSPTADPASRSVLMKLDLPPSAGLRAGMFGRVMLARRSESVVTVSPSSLVRRGQLEIVYVVEGGRAHLRLVRAGKVRGARLEILAGLESGEEVIAEPARVVEGQRVEARTDALERDEVLP